MNSYTFSSEEAKSIIKLVCKIILLFGICGLLFLLINFCGWKIIGNQYEMNFMASIMDKIARLESISGPKIILVGNSNVAFGFDSRMLEDEFGMPVVNLGLHGGLGNKFHESIAKRNIGNGDIVIICYTTYSDDGNIKDKDVAWITLEYHRALWEIPSIKDMLELVPAYKTYLINTYNLWKDNRGNQVDQSSSYSRTALNEYGDVWYRPPEKTALRGNIFFEGGLKEPEINRTCINRLNRLNDYCIKQGAIMLAAGFPIAMGDVSPPADRYQTFQAELAEKLNCEVISDYRDYFYPYSYFYDTSYHLTEKAARVRTQQLIVDLHNWGLN